MAPDGRATVAVVQDLGGGQFGDQVGSSREIGEVEFAAWLRACSSKLHVGRRRATGKATSRRRTTRKKK
jgi:hypothetical protein